MWPPKSPDLSPFDNLWTIVQSKLDEIPVASSRKGLADNLKLIWKKIPRETISNLISGIPEHVHLQACAGEGDGYIGK